MQDPEADPGMGRAAAAGAATLAVQHFLAAGSAPGASAALAVLCAALDRCNQGSTGVFIKAFEGNRGLGDGGKLQASIVTKVMVCTGACGCFLGPPRPFQSAEACAAHHCDEAARSGCQKAACCWHGHVYGGPSHARSGRVEGVHADRAWWPDLLPAANWRKGGSVLSWLPPLVQPQMLRRRRNGCTLPLTNIHIDETLT